MKYAIRLSLPPVSVFSHPRLPRGYNAGDVLGVYGVTRLDITEQQFKAVQNTFPPEMRERLENVWVFKVRDAEPHIHTGLAKCAVNWYLEENGEQVVFYGGECVPVFSNASEDGSDGYTVCHPDHLKPAYTITPEEGQVWLIDVTTPHAVIKQPGVQHDGNSFRLMLHCTFSLSFDEVAGLCRSYGYCVEE